MSWQVARALPRSGAGLPVKDCKHTITTRIEKGGRDPQAWITIALLIGDNSLELLLPMANKPQDLPSCGWVAPQINI